MPRNIVLLSDGTGNSAGKLFKTNVWRVYQALVLSHSGQVAFYDDGVGTSSFKPLALIGGAFGWGLKRNIIALYIFLCKNYSPDDRIFGFGFSRGAFTIRVLTRFLLAKGLVTDFTSSDDLRRKAHKLYREFRVEQSAGCHFSQVARSTAYLILRPFEPKSITTQSVPHVAFLGLWDTVDAYGMPVEELKVGIDRYIWPLSLNDRELDRRIEKACHALSIDDKRTSFFPLLWDELESKIEIHTDDETLSQVWFAGVHSNVGGGYPDDGLSYVSLRWMINNARKKGLVFKSQALEQINENVAPFGRLYDSRAGFGAYYRYQPRRLDPPAIGKTPVSAFRKCMKALFGEWPPESTFMRPSTYPAISGLRLMILWRRVKCRMQKHMRSNPHESQTSWILPTTSTLFGTGKDHLLRLGVLQPTST
jgi:uncharacterized protein (DUF2235 family)